MKCKAIVRSIGQFGKEAARELLLLIITRVGWWLFEKFWTTAPGPATAGEEKA